MRDDVTIQRRFSSLMSYPGRPMMNTPNNNILTGILLHMTRISIQIVICDPFGCHPIFWKFLFHSGYGILLIKPRFVVSLSNQYIILQTISKNIHIHYLYPSAGKLAVMCFAIAIFREITRNTDFVFMSSKSFCCDWIFIVYLNGFAIKTGIKKSRRTIKRNI